MDLSIGFRTMPAPPPADGVHTPRRSFTCSRSTIGPHDHDRARGDEPVSLVVYRPLGGRGLPIAIERRLGPEGERIDLLVPQIRF